MEEAAPRPEHRADCAASMAFWKQFDLDAKRVEWDRTCTDMREQKTVSIAGRKRLNDLTKGFRSKSKEEQMMGMTELLKAYQEEIDQLSRRSKFSEAAFFGIYKVMYDAPDPAPCMEQLFNNAVSGSTHALEIERLTAELHHYDEEFRQLRNQDITIRRLEDQLQEFKDSTEEQVVAEVQRRLMVLQAQCDERVQAAQEQQYSAEKRCQTVTESAMQAQFLADRAQATLLEASGQYDERISRLVAENALLAESTQRLQMTLAETDSQLQHARRLLAGDAVSASPSHAQQQQHSAAAQQSAYERIVTQLTDEARALAAQLRADKVAYEKATRELQQQLQVEQLASAGLRTELQGRVSREELDQLRRQIRVLQKIAFQKPEDDDDDDKSGSGVGAVLGVGHGVGAGADEPESTAQATESRHLEDLLVHRIQTLDHDLAQARAALGESRQQETALRASTDALAATAEASAQLVRRLELELEQRSAALEAMVLAQPPQASVASRSQMQDLAELLETDLQPPAKATARTPKSAASLAVASSTATSSSSAGEASAQMMTWLQSQRDRYKDKLTQAEAGALRLQQQLDGLQTRYAQLEHDNVQLYARIKYLQNLPSAGGGGGGRRWQRDAEEGRFSDDTEERVEGKYGALYEQRMSPFAEFSLIEKQRKLRELSVADRIVLNTTMAVVSNHTGRSALLLYLGAMHLLVFVTIYYSAHNVHHGCDPALDHAQAHAQSVLG